MECDDGFVLIPNYGCSQFCYTNMFLKGKICYPCDSLCTFCDKVQNNCYACVFGATLTGNTCNCSDGYRLNGSNC
jgi:hypothetical protein